MASDSDEEGLAALRQAALLSIKKKSSTSEARSDTPVDEVVEEEEEEYVPCNTVDQLVDVGFEEPYSPSRPALVDSSGSAYVPSRDRPSVRVPPTVPALHADSAADKDRGDDLDNAKLAAKQSSGGSEEDVKKKSINDDESKPDALFSDGDEEVDLLYGDLNCSLLNEDEDEDLGSSHRDGVRKSRPVKSNHRELKPVMKPLHPHARSQNRDRRQGDGRPYQTVAETTAMAHSHAERHHEQAAAASAPLVAGHPPTLPPAGQWQMPLPPGGWLPPLPPQLLASGLVPFHHGIHAQAIVRPMHAGVPVPPASHPSSYVGLSEDRRRGSPRRRRSRSRDRSSSSRHRRSRHSHDYDGSGTSGSSRRRSGEEHRSRRDSPESNYYRRRSPGYRLDRHTYMRRTPSPPPASRLTSRHSRPSRCSPPPGEGRYHSRDRHSDCAKYADERRSPSSGRRSRSNSAGGKKQRSHHHVCSRHRPSPRPSQSPPAPAHCRSPSPSGRERREQRGSPTRGSRSPGPLLHGQWSRSATRSASPGDLRVTLSDSGSRQSGTPTRHDREHSEDDGRARSSAASFASDSGSHSSHDDSSSSSSSSSSSTQTYTQPLDLSPPPAHRRRVQQRSQQQQQQPAFSPNRRTVFTQHFPSPQSSPKPVRRIVQLTSAPAPSPPLTSSSGRRLASAVLIPKRK